MSICCESNFYILKYNREVVDKHVGDFPEEGLETAFDVVTEIQEGYVFFLPFFPVDFRPAEAEGSLRLT